MAEMHGQTLFKLCAILLLLSTALASRPLQTGSAQTSSNPEERLHKSVQQKLQDGVKAEELEQSKEVELDLECKNLEEEECLNRRTLAAHTDYIYTQHHRHP
uniref:Phytosulfokine n=1 Tax=Wollemia nobilis TaxID=56998 RepID=A0A0C9S4Q4_9CONI